MAGLCPVRGVADSAGPMLSCDPFPTTDAASPLGFFSLCLSFLSITGSLFRDMKPLEFKMVLRGNISVSSY